MVQNCNKIISKVTLLTNQLIYGFLIAQSCSSLLSWNKDKILLKSFCRAGPSNELVPQIEPHPKSCQYPLINYHSLPQSRLSNYFVPHLLPTLIWSPNIANLSKLTIPTWIPAFSTVAWWCACSTTWPSTATRGTAAPGPATTPPPASPTTRKCFSCRPEDVILNSYFGMIFWDDSNSWFEDSRGWKWSEDLRQRSWFTQILTLWASQEPKRYKGPSLYYVRVFWGFFEPPTPM